ncbi:MAG TPA: aminotransferase class III-fold pyridoxal phosphate-dependent enzyme, partial [Candidatus Methanoperedenaceae archaeon]|nr:aminotransferase class III-fold pyridoxal phosphate-dependent enzyme [Candidatus Methanoperedenaceae archaeon]
MSDAPLQWEGVPGKGAIGVIARDMAVISPSLPRVYPFVVERGEGVYLFDVDGNRFLDFAAGAGVMGLGYQNPHVVSAARDQVGRLMHSGFSSFYAELPVRFAEKLTKVTGYDRV